MRLGFRHLPGLLLGFWIAVALVSPALAQEETATVTEHERTVALLDEEIAELERESAQRPPAEGESERGARLEDLAAETLNSLQAAREAELLSIAALKSRAEATRLLPLVLAELERPVDPPVPFVPREMALEEVQRGLAIAQARGTSLRNDAEALASKLQGRADRRQALPELVANARAVLAEREAIQDAALPEELSPEEKQALERARSADRRALAAQLSALENEMAGLATLQEHETLQAQLLDLRAAGAAKAVATWQAEVEERRQRETRKMRHEVEAALRREKTAHPVLKKAAEANRKLTEALLGLVRDNEDLAHEVRETRDALEKVSKAYADAERRSAAGGMRSKVGKVLRRERAELPPLGAHRRRITDYESKLADVRLQDFDWEDDLDALSVPEQLLDEMLLGMPPGTSEEATKRIREEGSELLSSRRGYLTRLRLEAETLARNLDEAEGLERDLVAQTEAFSDYINKHVLWIRSQDPFWSVDYGEAPEGVLWILDPRNWVEVARSLKRSASERLATCGFGLAVLLALLLLRRRLGRWLDSALHAAKGRGYVSLRPTLDSLLATLGLTLLLPGALAFLTWLLGGDEGAGFPRALASGLRSALPLVFLVEFLRQLLRTNGLAANHFRWPNVAERRKPLRLLVLALPLWVLILVYEANRTTAWNESLGNPALVGVLALFIWFALLSSRSTSLLAWRGSWTRSVWLLGAGATIALLGATLLGYSYTAIELVQRLVDSAWIVVALAVLHSFGGKWVLTARVFLAQRQAREARKATGDSARATESAGKEAEIEMERKIDLAEVDSQTRQLLNAFIAVAMVMSLARVWAEVLPALSVFDGFTLWSYVPADAAAADPPVDVTLWDLLRALALVGITVFAGRNLPGFLEVALLQRLRIGAGERYAATAVARYTIVVVGIVLAFGALGIGWAKVQWLVAAVTVGLGFGMQEIFANFVSGLILLFEQPIRVGDWVTIGDIDGKVVRIQMRATSIIDRDLKELIVPNKDFVTGRLINWSLSNPVSRVKLPVGVAYGSDTEKATRILLDIARNDSNVLKEPAPSVVFKTFGDSTLNLELRVFIDDRDKYPKMLHPLNTAIHMHFAEAGIEIAFPQRDLHLRSSEPLERFLGGLKGE